MPSIAAQLRPLRQALDDARAQHAPRSTQQLKAFENLFRESCRLGQPLDALRKHSRDESERFFARTIPGPDGHVYWDGGKYFYDNAGKTRVPRRWWWTHRHGRELGAYEDLVPICGEKNCINPDHAEVGRGLRRLRFDHETIVGTLQVAALRLGHTPSSREWERLKLRPDVRVVRGRFGSWAALVKAAGLAPANNRGAQFTPIYNEQHVIDALRLVGAIVNRKPSENDFQDHRDKLRERGLPTSTGTVRRFFGNWPDAVRKAGLA